MTGGFGAFVEEPLRADAEDICALFEVRRSDFEELRRSRRENQRLQRLLDSALRALSPRVLLHREGVQVSSPTPRVKEENNIGQEENELQVSVPEFGAVSVKTEESSLLQQRQKWTHEGKKPFGCSVCSKVSLSSKLKRHKRTQHRLPV